MHPLDARFEAVAGAAQETEKVAELVVRVVTRTGNELAPLDGAHDVVERARNRRT